MRQIYTAKLYTKSETIIQKPLLWQDLEKTKILHPKELIVRKRVIPIMSHTMRNKSSLTDFQTEIPSNFKEMLLCSSMANFLDSSYWKTRKNKPFGGISSCHVDFVL